MGRKPLLADENMKKILIDAIKVGMSNQKACELAGISESVFYLWIETAESDLTKGKTSKNSIYLELLENIKKARASFQARHLSRITKASDDGVWQASAWLLERRFPQEFSLKSDVNITNEKIAIVADIPKEEED